MQKSLFIGRSIFISLLALGSAMYPISTKESWFWGLVGSADGDAEQWAITDYYQRCVVQPNKYQLPNNDPASLNKVAYKMILVRHKRLAALSSDKDYEALWNTQPAWERFWWTIKYRRPYTHFLPIALIAGLSGGVYGVYKVIGSYRNKESRAGNQTESLK